MKALILVLTLSLSHPLIAQVVRGDIDGDGKSDVVLFANLGRPLTAQLVRGDMNGDGKSDIVTFANKDQNPGDSGGTAFWLMDGQTRLRQCLGGSLNNTYTVQVGDFNGDHRADMLIRGPNDVRVMIWTYPNLDPMTGCPATRPSDGGPDVQILNIGGVQTDYQVEWIADLDNDGTDDLFWRGKNDGRLVIWRMSNFSPTSVTVFGVQPDYKIEGVGDLDGDGFPDIVWRGRNDGAVVVWFMNGASSVREVRFIQTVDTSYHIIAVADLNGDGKADILWQGPYYAVVRWLMDGANITDVNVQYYTCTQEGSTDDCASRRQVVAFSRTMADPRVKLWVQLVPFPESLIGSQVFWWDFPSSPVMMYSIPGVQTVVGPK